MSQHEMQFKTFSLGIRVEEGLCSRCMMFSLL